MGMKQQSGLFLRAISVLLVKLFQFPVNVLEAWTGPLMNPLLAFQKQAQTHSGPNKYHNLAINAKRSGLAITYIRDCRELLPH